MQHHHTHHQKSTRFGVGSVHHRPEIPHQKPDAHREAHAHSHPVQHRDRTPADQRNGNPDHIGVAVQGPALDQTRAVAGPEPAQQPPQRDGNEAGVAIDEAGGAAQEMKVIDEMDLEIVGQVAGNRAGEEENEDDGGGDPEGPVQVRVAVQDVEEGRARVEGRLAAAQDLGRIDVKVLRVEGERPQEAFGRGRGRARERIAAAAVRGDFAGVRGVRKV